jgi:hypothetical protein
MEVISYNQSVLPDEIAELIFEYTDVLTLILISKTCKKYRSEYIVNLHNNRLAVLIYNNGGKLMPMIPCICLNILREPYVETIPARFGTVTNIYPVITHPFTRRMVERMMGLCSGAQNLAWAWGFEV